jgi:diacylglycerol kinase (ATP)
MIETPVNDTLLPLDRTKRWVRLLVNPSSGAQSAVAQLPTIVGALEDAGMQVVLSFTALDRPPTDLATQAAKAHYDLVVVAGGDGTVSAVAQGLFGTETPLGILPVGTFNNIARSLGIPRALDEALAVLFHGRPWRIDSATVNDTPFMEVAGVGLDAGLFPVAEEIKSGAWYQVGSAVQTLRDYRPRRVQIELADGRRVVTSPLLAIVSKMPFFGMGFAIAPTARPDSGQLVLSVFEGMTKLQLVAYFAAISNGREMQEPDISISTYQSTRFEIRTVAGAPIPVQADGRVVDHTPAVFQVVPHALTVFAPQRSD